MDQLVSKLQQVSMAQMFLVSVLFTGFYYLTSYDDGAAYDSQLQGVIGQIDQKKLAFVKTKKQMENAEKFQREVTEFNELYAQVLEYLPAEVDAKEFRGKIIQQARVAGASVVKVNSINLRSRKQDYEEIAYEVEMRGDYNELTQFLANLTTLKAIVSFKDFEVVTREEKDERVELTLTTEIVTYSFLEKK